jgi:hypothetical protein
MRFLVSCALLSLSFSAGAVEVYWLNSSGGTFSDPANWGGSLPAISDVCMFTNPASYRIQFLRNEKVSDARFFEGVVTQDVGSSVWSVTNHWQAGETSGANSKVVHVNGTLAVTNGVGEAILEIGGLGKGELELKGGEIVADFLSAPDLNKSKFTFTSGRMTLLHGGNLGGAYCWA